MIHATPHHHHSDETTTMRSAGSPLSRHSLSLAMILAVLGPVLGLESNRFGGLATASSAGRTTAYSSNPKSDARHHLCFLANGQGGGSGVLMTADGYAITNYHVVEPCGEFMHCSLPDGQLYDAVLVGSRSNW